MGTRLSNHVYGSGDRQLEKSVSISAASQSMLHELAQTMVSVDNYRTAQALRKLAGAGYHSLEQVDAASDWVLLAVPGIGIGRLSAVRQLIWPEWQPPSTQALRAAEQFLSATRFALRFWPVDVLEQVIQTSSPVSASNESVDKRLAMEVFSRAVRRTSRLCEIEDLVRAVRQVGGNSESRIHVAAESHSATDAPNEACNNGDGDAPASSSSRAQPRRRRRTVDSDHFAYARDGRREIVEHYRSAIAKGKVGNKEQWAQTRYNISARTLLRYEREFFP